MAVTGVPYPFRSQMAKVELRESSKIPVFLLGRGVIIRRPGGNSV
jgi:hypothetical protein